MTDAQLIAYINQYIITNGVNAITAAVLNPILQAIRQRSQDVTGDPADLTTSDTTNLVAAINSLQALINDFEFSGVQVYSGTDNPNDTEPASFNVGDFYKQVDGGGNTIELFQYNGTSWVSYEIATDTPVTQKLWKKIFITPEQALAGEIQDNDFIGTTMDYIISSLFGTQITDFTFVSETGTITRYSEENEIIIPHYTK